MKLVRLISDSERESDYYCQFQEPFEIKPDSRISLQNFSVKIDDTINIDRDNLAEQRIDVVYKFNIGDEDNQILGAIKLPAGDYEYDDFITMLGNEFNAGLTNPLSAEGAFTVNDNEFMEMSCAVDDFQRCQVSYNIHGITQDTHIELDGVVSNGANPAIYAKDEEMDVESWAFLFSNQTASLSKGQMFAEITFNYVSGTNGWAFGLANYEALSEANYGNEDDTFTPDMYESCIFTEGDNYFVKDLNGTETNTGVPALDGDRIQIGQGRNGDTSASASIVKYQVVRQDGGAIVSLHTHNNLAATNTYHIAASISRGVDVLTLSGLKFVESETSTTNVPANSFKYYSLKFNQSSANKLGFSATTAKYIFAVDGTWGATNPLYESIVPPTIVIEIPTLAIASYDSKSNFSRRRSLIGVIPSTSLIQDTNAISYSQPYPVFLDIKNKATQLINSLRVRILDQNDEPLKIAAEGKAASVVVIFD
jgi:hypothetical protein